MPTMHDQATILKRILVIDDDHDIREMLYHSLTLANYTVNLADCGKSAIDMLRTFTPDLIILDVMLPDIDGLTALQEMWSIGYQGPVILLTGIPQAQLQTRLTHLRERGTVDWVFLKPVRRTDLLSKMEELFLKEEAIQHALDSRGEGWYLQRVLPIPEVAEVDLAGWQGWVVILVSDTGKLGHDLVTFFPKRIEPWKVLTLDDLPGLTT